jgi:hypothetical protein
MWWLPREKVTGATPVNTSAAAGSGQLTESSHGTRMDATKEPRDALFHLESIEVVGSEGDGRRRANCHDLWRSPAKVKLQIGSTLVLPRCLAPPK